MAPPTQQPKSRSQDHLLSSTPLRKVPSTEAQKNPYPSQWSPPRGASPQAEPRRQEWRKRYELARKGCTPATPAAPGPARESPKNSQPPQATVKIVRPLLRDTSWYKTRMELSCKFDAEAAAVASKSSQRPTSLKRVQHPDASTASPVSQTQRGDTWVAKSIPPPYAQLPLVAASSEAIKSGCSYQYPRAAVKHERPPVPPARDDAWRERYELARQGSISTSSTAPRKALEGPHASDPQSRTARIKDLQSLVQRDDSGAQRAKHDGPDISFSGSTLTTSVAPDEIPSSLSRPASQPSMASIKDEWQPAQLTNEVPQGCPSAQPPTPIRQSSPSPVQQGDPVNATSHVPFRSSTPATAVTLRRTRAHSGSSAKSVAGKWEGSWVRSGLRSSQDSSLPWPDPPWPPPSSYWSFPLPIPPEPPPLSSCPNHPAVVAPLCPADPARCAHVPRVVALRASPCASTLLLMHFTRRTHTLGSPRAAAMERPHMLMACAAAEHPLGLHSVVRLQVSSRRYGPRAAAQHRSAERTCTPWSAGLHLVPSDRPPGCAARISVRIMFACCRTSTLSHWSNHQCTPLARGAVERLSGLHSTLRLDSQFYGATVRCKGAQEVRAESRNGERLTRLHFISLLVMPCPSPIRAQLAEILRMPVIPPSRVRAPSQSLDFRVMSTPRPLLQVMLEESQSEERLTRLHLVLTLRTVTSARFCIAPLWAAALQCEGFHDHCAWRQSIAVVAHFITLNAHDPAASPGHVMNSRRATDWRQTSQSSQRGDMSEFSNTSTKRMEAVVCCPEPYARPSVALPLARLPNRYTPPFPARRACPRDTGTGGFHRPCPYLHVHSLVALSLSGRLADVRKRFRGCAHAPASRMAFTTYANVPCYRPDSIASRSPQVPKAGPSSNTSTRPFVERPRTYTPCPFTCARLRASARMHLLTHVPIHLRVLKCTQALPARFCAASRSSSERACAPARTHHTGTSMRLQEPVCLLLHAHPCPPVRRSRVFDRAGPCPTSAACVPICLVGRRSLSGYILGVTHLACTLVPVRQRRRSSVSSSLRLGHAPVSSYQLVFRSQGCLEGAALPGSISSGVWCTGVTSLPRAVVSQRRYPYRRFGARLLFSRAPDVLRAKVFYALPCTGGPIRKSAASRSPTRCKHQPLHIRGHVALAHAPTHPESTIAAHRSTCLPELNCFAGEETGNQDDECHVSGVATTETDVLGCEMRLYELYLAKSAREDVLSQYMPPDFRSLASLRRGKAYSLRATAAPPRAGLLAT
ncbi:hypothetical protein GGX14DRAFT_564908 [Mycena pura]|uniref:Uncharacterized protein n=1 Tax=Mycena pura TaxID=153505 RepID=A0AAD6YI74_9AGAR|nr:hypothetical protein GGX14DRAFT_564908 [Mycena pura]